MSNASFSAQVSDWVREVEGAAEAIFKASVDDLVEDAVRTTPVDTGFLRGSVTGGVNAEPSDIDDLRPENSYVAEIEPARLGDTVSVRWTAEYAEFVEYGTSKMAPRGFVRQAVQKWPDIVKANEMALGAKIGR